MFFANGLSRKLGTLAAFQTYNEARNEISVAIRLRWTYLVTFPRKQVPEKQEISIYASQSSPLSILKYLQFMNIFPIAGNENLGYVEIEIDHTERTWGDDIESMITNHISQYIREESRFSKSLRKFAPILPIPIFFLAIGGSSFAEHAIQKAIIAEHLERVGEINRGLIVAIPQLSEKLDLILLMQEAGADRILGILPFVASLFFSFIMAMALFWVSVQYPPSFVAVTSAAAKRRLEIIKKRKVKISFVVMSFILSLIAGVAANYLYFFLMTRGGA